MPFQPILPRLVSILLMLSLMLEFGCRGWIEKPIAPDSGTGVPQVGRIRITRRDGTKVTLREHTLRNDSLVGFLDREHRVRAAVARTDVSKIETRGDTTPRGVRIAGKVYLGVLTVLGLALAITGIMYGNAARKSH